jgi:hypothetical protein
VFKYVFLAIAMMLPGMIWAGCSSSDFRVEAFAVEVDNCVGRRCPRLNVTGRLVNNCQAAAGAQVKVEAMDNRGNVIDTVDGWPAMTENLAPGEAAEFDFGPLFRYRSGMVDFSVAVTEVRSW